MGRYQPFTIMRSAALAAVAVAGTAAGARVAHADALLEEMVGFTGQVFFIDAKVPAVIIGAVRDGDVAVAGFGERAGPGGPPPAATPSLGSALHRRRARPHDREGRGRSDRPSHQVAARPRAWRKRRHLERVTSLSLATHAGGFPREVPHEAGPYNDPFATI